MLDKMAGSAEQTGAIGFHFCVLCLPLDKLPSYSITSDGVAISPGTDFRSA